MLEREFLFYDRHAGPRHIQIALTFAAILALLAGAGIAAAGVTWFATEGNPFVRETMQLNYANGWHYVVILLSAATIIALWRGQRSSLDLALMLALWAWLLE